MLLRAYKKTIQLVIAGFASSNFVGLPQHEYKKINLLNKVTLLQHLKLKGANVELYNLLQDEIIQLAEKYEFYPILMEQLATKKIFHGMKFGFENVQKLSKQLSLSERSFKSLVQAIEWNHYLKPKVNKEVFDIDRKEEILRQIGIMEAESNITGSNNIRYYMLNHKLYYYNIIESIEKRKETANEILLLLQNSKAVYSANRLGIIHSNIADIEAFESNYISAIQNLKLAKKYFPLNTKNYFLTIQEEFRCHFYNKDFDKARDVFECLKAGFHSSFNEFEKQQIKLLEACLFIETGKFEKALEIVGKEKFNQKNPSYEFWRRMYQIFLFLKLKNEENAAKSFLSFQQLLYRWPELKTLSKREQITYGIMADFFNNGFDDTINNTVERLSQLQNNSELSWKPFLAETIPFENLFEKIS
ncbi:MAG: hypothetical protein H0X62_13480 [Bacteroidetes bacterium]|nr:hypothetical protein [Bacteroidota bacterium]